MEEGNGGQVARATVIDVPMKAQRSLATVTAEILSYQEAARRMVITYSIEIGRRLIEAKEMVNHGEWGNYIREKLGFSQQTANNHMVMFRAYAADQMRLDGDNLKNQAFGNLSYTQALALLALPSEEEREAFVREHDVSGMSTRELREELKRRDQGSGIRNQGTGEAGNGSFDSGSASAQDDKGEEPGRIAELTTQLAKANSRANDAEEERDRIIRETEESRGKAEAAERRAREAEEQLQQAQRDLKKAQMKLTDAEKNPKIPKATMDKLKAEAEEAAKKGMETDQAEVEQARAKVAQAEEEAASARREAEAAARGLAALREEKEQIEKELKAAAPEVAQFRFLFEGAQEALNRCVEALPGLPPDKVPGCTKAIKRVLEATLETLEDDKWEAAMPE